MNNNRKTVKIIIFNNFLKTLILILIVTTQLYKQLRSSKVLNFNVRIERTPLKIDRKVNVLKIYIYLYMLE